MRVLRQLLGGDRVLAHLARLGEDLQVAREPRSDAERELLTPGYDVLLLLTARWDAIIAATNYVAHRL